MRKDDMHHIALVSPRHKQLSPKISPKLKSTIKTIKLKDKMSSKKDKNGKTEGQMIKPFKNVLEIVRQFENKDDSDMNAETVDSKKVKNDAFEALMNARVCGDAQKRTPVRKRVKRLDKITSKESSPLLNWVTKNQPKK